MPTEFPRERLHHCFGWTEVGIPCKREHRVFPGGVIARREGHPLMGPGSAYLPPNVLAKKKKLQTWL